FFQAADGIRDRNVTGVQTCALPIYVLINIVLGSGVALILGFRDKQLAVNHHVQCLLLELILIRLFTGHLRLHSELLVLALIHFRKGLAGNVISIVFVDDIGNVIQIGCGHFLPVLLFDLCGVVFGIITISATSSQ